MGLSHYNFLMEELSESQVSLLVEIEEIMGHKEEEIVSSKAISSCKDEYESTEQTLSLLTTQLKDCKTYLTLMKKRRDELEKKMQEFQRDCGSVEHGILIENSEEISKFLHYIDEIEEAQDSVEGDLIEPRFTKTLIELEGAKKFFTKNFDYPNSQKFLLQIQNVKTNLCEVMKDRVQNWILDKYEDRMPVEEINEETFTLYKGYLCSPIESFDDFKDNFKFFQKFSIQESIKEYIDLIQLIWNMITSIRKKLLAGMSNYMIQRVIDRKSFSLILQGVIETQSYIIEEEYKFLERYFHSVDREAIGKYFEELVYEHIKPVILKEDSLKELYMGTIFLNKTTQQIPYKNHLNKVRL